MAISIGNTSAWKSLTNLNVGVGGVWKQAQAVWVGAGGVWKAAWSYINAVAVYASASDADITNGYSSAMVEYRNSGYVYKAEYHTSGNAPQLVGTWLLTGSNSDFEIYLSGTGDTPLGSALNTWMSLSATRSWYLESNSGAGIKSFSGTIQIRRASDSVVVSTAGLDLSAESTL